MNAVSHHFSRFWAGWLLIAAVVVLGVITLRGKTPRESGLAANAGSSTPANQTPADEPAPRPAVLGGSSAEPVPDGVERMLALEQAEVEQGEKDQKFWRDGFAAQQVNPTWAHLKEQEILQLVESDQFKGLETKPSDLKVECRTSLCRVTADFTSASAAQDWTEFFTLYSASRFTGGATRQENQPDGSARLVIIAAARD